MAFFRRAAAVSLAAAALVAFGAVSAASAAPAGAPASVSDGRHPYPGGHGGPIRFGPIVIPSDGQFTGGFAWDTSGSRHG
ncbi:hypothetical protein [Streptomyces sp. NPDC002994]|uniref:hypothetical protein n=1 Tax=Streptomyces sp. NPDC002994 TaxID=3154441 RepID=UPI0033A6136F